MQGEPRRPLPVAAKCGHEGAPQTAGSAAGQDDAKAALVQLIDGQIATRRAEIDELTRLRQVFGG